ncbi:MAG: lysine transporter LysE, partial [Salegentibacter sp.]
MEETKLFLITYFAALIGVIPPGLVNMTVAKT